MLDDTETAAIFETNGNVARTTPPILLMTQLCGCRSLNEYAARNAFNNTFQYPQFLPTSLRSFLSRFKEPCLLFQFGRYIVHDPLRTSCSDRRLHQSDRPVVLGNFPRAYLSSDFNQICVRHGMDSDSIHVLRPLPHSAVSRQGPHKTAHVFTTRFCLQVQEN